MISLRDGPAKGAYLVKRAPYYLRAVVDRVTGKADVLNELADVPSFNERVYIYKAVTEPHLVHVNFGSARRGTGFYMSAHYKYMPGVDGEGLRDRDSWRKWVLIQIGDSHEVDWTTGVMKPTEGDVPC